MSKGDKPPRTLMIWDEAEGVDPIDFDKLGKWAKKVIIMNATTKKYQYLDHEPEMICLIGSSRFRDLHLKILKEETLKGNIVLVMGLFGHNEGLDMDGPVKKMLDELHFVKIDHSSIVIVCNEMVPYCPDCETFRINNMGCKCEKAWQGWLRPYIGESTRRELEYAELMGKVIRYVNTPNKSVHADTYFNKQGTETGRIQTKEPNVSNQPATLKAKDWIGEHPGIGSSSSSVPTGKPIAIPPKQDYTFSERDKDQKDK